MDLTVNCETVLSKLKALARHLEVLIWLTRSFLFLKTSTFHGSKKLQVSFKMFQEEDIKIKG